MQKDDERPDIDDKALSLSPEKARAKLEYLGFTSDRWDDILRKNLTSHEVRALISIASGTETKFLGAEYRKEREKDGLPPDRLASRLK